MPRGCWQKGAPWSVAPFLFVLILQGLYWPAAASGSAQQCSYQHVDERTVVAHVTDGDTVRLQDGRRVRLIGINTPELGQHGHSDEPLARTARNTLQQLIESGNRSVLLQYGSERKDHYGRLLADVFLENGTNVAVTLLDQGLATTLVVPPNTRNQDCYQTRENRARHARRGLWKLAGYQPVTSTALSADEHGFRIVQGKVAAIRHTRFSTWIELTGTLTLHINRQDLANFQQLQLDKLKNRMIEVRGWLRPAGKRLQMNIRHPAALTMLNVADRQHRR